MDEAKLGKLMYPDQPSPKGDSDLATEPVEAGCRSEQQFADLVYPEPDERFVSHSEDGQVATILRRVDQTKLVEGNYHGDRRALAASNAPYLRGADLTEVRLSALARKFGDVFSHAAGRRALS